MYRPQEMPDVDNESILNAISYFDNNAKELLVNVYVIYADTSSADLVAKLDKHIS